MQCSTFTFIEDVWQPLLAKAGVAGRKYDVTRHYNRDVASRAGTDLQSVTQRSQ